MRRIEFELERKIWEREGSQNIRTQSKRTNWLKWLIFDLLCCLDMDLYENDIVFIGLFLSILLSAHFISSSCRKQIRNQISKSNCATTFQRRHLIQLTDFFRKWISIVKCHAVHQIRHLKFWDGSWYGPQGLRWWKSAGPPHPTLCV